MPYVPFSAGVIGDGDIPFLVVVVSDVGVGVGAVGAVVAVPGGDNTTDG